MKQRRTAFTMVEITISAMIGALILTAAFRLLSGSMRSTSKGSAHLTNVQTTNTLMAFIEFDAARTTDLTGLTPGTPENTVQMTVREGPSFDPVTIVYDKGPGNIGVFRRLNRGGTTEQHQFCRDVMVQKLAFTRLDLPGNRLALHVSLHTATPPDGTEEFHLERFIHCRNHASNSRILGWQDP